MIPQTRLQHVQLKLAKNLKNRGVWGTFKVCALKACDLARELTPEYWRERKNEKAFDIKYGVKTDYLIELDELDVADRAIPNRGYMPTPAIAIQPILASPDIDYPRFTFVDIGCGMGRVLMMGRFPHSRKS